MANNDAQQFLSKFIKDLSDSGYNIQNSKPNIVGEKEFKNAFNEACDNQEKAYTKLISSLKKQYEEYIKRVEQLEKDKKITTEQALQELIGAEQEYFDEVERLNKEKATKIADIKERSEIAYQKRRDTIFKKAQLNEKASLMKAEREDAERKKTALLNTIRLQGEATEEQKKQLTELNGKITFNSEHELAMLKAKREAILGNHSVEVQMQARQDFHNKREKAQEEIDLTFRQDMEAAAALYKEGTEDYNIAVASAEKRKKNSEKKANAEFGSLKQNFGFGSKEGKQNLLSMVSGGGKGTAGGGLNGIASIVKSVDSIKGVFTKAGGPLMILIELVRKISKGIDEGVKKYVSLQSQYLAKVNTRLDTGDLRNNKNFDTITKGFAKVFGSSRYVSQTSLVETLGKLAEAGIAYNLEQRTILSTLSDRMVSTFDMLDDTLTRLTKLQQADMSVAALGTESLITEFLNNNFQDTSYMSNVYDTINSALIEATSQMTQKEATSFTYNVQKWLGSLYSLGMSSGGVETLAKGITYLATGNINAFNSDDALRTLFALSSNGSYSDLLVNGVNASNVNNLLGNIVSYLADISTDTNQVTKQVKAGVFGGLSLSDIRSVANLTATDVETIKNSTASWDSAITHVSDYLVDFASQNTSLAIQAENLVQNTIYDLGKNLVNNQAAYVGYVVGDTIGGLIGEALKTVAKLSNIGGTAVELVKAIGTSFTSLEGSLTRASSFMLNNTNGSAAEKWLGWLGVGNQQTSYWDLSDSGLIKSRGNTYAGSSGVLNGISSSIATSYANYNDTALANTLYNQATTMEAGAVNYENGATALRDINDLYKALFEDQAAMRVILVAVEDQAQKDLTQNVYPTNDIDMDEVINEVKDTRYAINGRLTDIYNRQNMSYSVGL